MKRSLSFKIGAIIAAIVLATAVLSLFWTPYDPTAMDIAAKNQEPSLLHLFGTDNYGRDILSRVMQGTATTVFIAAATVLIGGAAGTAAGLFSGYVGGIADAVIMRVCDVLLSFPSILLALIIVGITGTGKSSIIIALSILFVPSFARMARAETMKIKRMAYVESAVTLGASPGHIMTFHILPNMRTTLLNTFAIGFNNAVLAESGMSYLGLGVQPPDSSLGRMLSEAQSYLLAAPWYAIFPGIAIIIIVLAFSLISDAGQSKRDIVN